MGGEEDEKGSCEAQQRWRNWAECATISDEAACYQGQFKSSQNWDGMFSISSPCFSFFCGCSVGFSAWYCFLAFSFAKLTWLESEEVTSVGHILPLTVSGSSPLQGTLRGRRTGCSSQDSHPFLSSRLSPWEALPASTRKLKVFKCTESILHLTKKCGIQDLCYKSKSTLFISSVLEAYH